MALGDYEAWNSLKGYGGCGLQILRRKQLAKLNEKYIYFDFDVELDKYKSFLTLSNGSIRNPAKKCVEHVAYNYLKESNQIQLSHL